MATSPEPLKAEFGAPLRLGDDDNGLAYHIFNPTGTETVLFLHAGGTGAPEWDVVLPHFSSRYHLLVPDLPFHNKSLNLGLKNPAAETADLLRDLIKSKAKDSQAHVIGSSLGAHIGRRLAIQHHSVVQTCFLSGYNRLDFDWMWEPWRSYIPNMIFAAEYTISKLIPSSWMDGIEHTTEMTTPHDLAQFKKIWPLLSEDGVRGKSWGARTLFVAATKGGLIPTNDGIKNVRELAELGRTGNPRTRAVQNKSMRHAWSRQDPKVFAEAAICWIEDRELPEGFEPI